MAEEDKETKIVEDAKPDDKVEDKEPKDLSDADAEGGDGNPEAPSDQPKPEDKSEDTPDADADAEDTDKGGDKELDTSVWGDTGDEVGNSVLQILQNSEMSVDDAKALIYDPLTQHGDPTKLDKDALIEKVGAAKANLVMAGIENYVSKQNARNAEILESVYDAAGGKDAWSKVAEWAKANVSEADRADYNEMLDAGGAKAKFAAAEYVRLYNADAGNTSVGKSTSIEGDASAGDQGEAITRVEYAERLAKLHRTGKATKAAIAEVQRARERGRKKGI